MATEYRNHKKSKQVMTFEEVQTYLGVKSRKTLLKFIRNGKLPAFKLGGTRWRFLRSDLKKFVNHGFSTFGDSVASSPLSLSANEKQ